MTSTAKRARTMAARYLTAEQIREIADRQNRSTTRKAARKSAPQITTIDRSKMAGKLATIGQMEAVNAYERTLGLKGYASLREFRAVVGDMKDASILRASLKAQIYG